MQIVSKPFWTGRGCASIYYERVPRSSKYLLWKSLVLTHNRPFDFCQGGLQSACQRVAVVHTGSKFWLKMCLRVSCTPQLAGSENTKAFWFSKLISINRGPAAAAQFETHAAPKQGSLHLQGVAEGKPDARRCRKGDLLKKCCLSGRGRLGWYPGSATADGKLLLSSKGSGFRPLCTSCWHWAKLSGPLNFLITW